MKQWNHTDACQEHMGGPEDSGVLTRQSGPTCMWWPRVPSCLYTALTVRLSYEFSFNRATFCSRSASALHGAHAVSGTQLFH